MEILEYLACVRVCVCVCVFVRVVGSTSIAAIVAQQPPHVLRQQLLLYGRVARGAPPDDPLRKLIFFPGGLQPTTGQLVRRVGRPRNEWAVMLGRESCKLNVNVNEAIYVEPEWRRAVYSYCMR